jgi:hypothetical protein
MPRLVHHQAKLRAPMTLGNIEKSVVLNFAGRSIVGAVGGCHHIPMKSQHRRKNNSRLVYDQIDRAVRIIEFNRPAIATLGHGWRRARRPPRLSRCSLLVPFLEPELDQPHA